MPLPNAQGPRAVPAADDQAAWPSFRVLIAFGSIALLAWIAVCDVGAHWLPGSVVFPALLYLMHWLFVRRRWTRRRHEPIHPKRLAASWLGLSPYLFVQIAGVFFALMAWRPMEPPGRHAWQLVALTSFASLIALPIGFVGASTATALAELRSSTLLKTVAALAAISALALGVVAVASALRMPGRVEPDNYRSSLHLRARLACDANPVEFYDFRFSMEPLKAGACSPSIQAPGGQQLTNGLADFLPLDRNQKLLVYLDEKSSMFILEIEGSHITWFVRMRDPVLQTWVSNPELTPSLCAPRMWILHGAAALAVALALLLFAALRTRMGSLVEGVADGSSCVVLPDGNACPLSPGVSAARGPVLVRLKTIRLAGHGEPYRRSPPRLCVAAAWSGTGPQVAEWFHDEASALCAGAFVVSMFAAVPLVMAAAFGLVF